MDEDEIGLMLAAAIKTPQQNKIKGFSIQFLNQWEYGFMNILRQL